MNYTGPQAMLAEIERLRIIVADYHDLQHRSNAIDDENERLRAALWHVREDMAQLVQQVDGVLDPAAEQSAEEVK